MKELIETLRREAKAFGPTLSKTAHARGLLVTDKDGSTRPIPITATPVILDAEEIKRRAHLSAHLSSAAFKMAKAVLSSSARDVLAAALSPVERSIMEKTFNQIARLATTRVDFFVSAKGPMALEINATIPAMQGYSDIAARTFIEVVGRHAGISDRQIAQLWAKNGSNAIALHQALLDGYVQERSKRPARIALLCRRNDAQISELRYLAERFNELGTEAEVVYPDQLSGNDKVQANGKLFDLVYRHLFVRRLEEIDAPYVRELFGQVPGKKAVLLNPPVSQMEVKTAFALLSQASVEMDLARAAHLAGDELIAIEQAVPWTRPFRQVKTVDPDGKQVTNLVDRVAAEPDRFVLKRAWDYGGKAVFVGRSVKEEGFDERVRAAYGASLRWPELCARAAEDRVGGGFVVQELIQTTPESHLLCTDRSVDTVEMFVDFSAYASVGLRRQPPWGGVCRGSPSRIVNIVGGGGVLPLITTDVANSLMTAFRMYKR
jgi:hypothetical protein